MAHYVHWQRQVTVNGSADIDVIGQNVLDVSKFGCLRVVAYASDALNCSLYIQTAPADEQQLWSDVTYFPGLTGGTRVALFLKASNTSSAGFERLIRWKIDAAATSWRITFTIHVLGYEWAL